MKTRLVIPTVLLSAALLLAGCTSGDLENGSQSNSSATEAPVMLDTPQPSPPAYVAPPADMEEKYKAYYFAPTTLNESSWAYYKLIGATTNAEDPSPRSTTVSEWEAARNDQENVQKFDKMTGEVTSDIEQTALKVSAFLSENPEANLDEVRNQRDLIINRYEKAGKVSVEQDEKSRFFFVVFSLNEGASEGSQNLGILVLQEGKTPEFK